MILYRLQNLCGECCRQARIEWGESRHEGNITTVTIVHVESPHSGVISPRRHGGRGLRVGRRGGASCSWSSLWPAGVFCCVLLGILTIVTIVKKGKGDAARRQSPFSRCR